ncbi:MAG: tRNA uridine-5-carboxymethylaminomethyl(34) synthesis GTPase MnmE [Rikenellaceae bacterium]|nr:tRNA uridine-5-carboxymethylaminomethyl(34) synthesis GTPase MnmE [Rikenellaceae bacterium]
MFNDGDIIVAPATPTGGALCLVRLSGKGSIELCDRVFRGRRRLAEAATATLHYGEIVDGEEVVDDVVVSIFRAPHSYTAEESVEISAHGSRYVVERILALLVRCGARMAEAGEFTRRAFLAGRMDLSQAEAVADVIAADSHASHAVAATQMRGAYSQELEALRGQLLHITSLLELELDFSEEDVEFADRGELLSLLAHTLQRVDSLAASFALGNALKEGVTVAIAGRPNVGKSTLLNRLAGEDRAMVSEIAGTTRDTIEATANIGGVIYRFVDTAGLHATDDRLEQMGIERTAEALRKARIILWLTDKDDSSIEKDLIGYIPSEDQKIYRIITKIDLRTEDAACAWWSEANYPTIALSAKSGEGVDQLQKALQEAVDATGAYNGEVIVSNRRHHEALREAGRELEAAIAALEGGVPTDLLSEDIRQAIHQLGIITGEITTDDVLKNIFSKFCVGK